MQVQQQLFGDELKHYLAGLRQSARDLHASCVKYSRAKQKAVAKKGGAVVSGTKWS